MKGGAGRRRTGGTDGFSHLLSNSLEADAKGPQRLGRYAVALVDEAEQDVLGADEVVVEEPRFLLGQHQDSSGTVGEALEHVSFSIPGPGR